MAKFLSEQDFIFHRIDGSSDSDNAIIKDTALKSIKTNLTFDENTPSILFIFFILIVFTHRKNISNLKNKTEKKIKI